MNSASSSAARRDRANPIDFTPSSASRAIRNEVSVSALLRAPDSSSTIGGFHSANVLPPLGERSSVTASNGSPTRRSASSTGLPTVADASTNVGSPP